MVRNYLPALHAGEAGLTRYLAEIQKFPLLQPQEEYDLAQRYRQHNDLGAAHKLVTSHLRLVAKVAVSYRGYGLPFGEVISEGNIGLMQAVKRFIPERGVRLATYALWWIRSSIQEYVLRSWSLVKIGTTRDQKRLFFNLRKMKNKISAFEEGELYPEHLTQIANNLKVSEEEVRSMNQRLAGDKSLNLPMRIDGESRNEWQDFLIDERPSQEQLLTERNEREFNHNLLENALAALKPREEEIFRARRLQDPPATLEQLAQIHNISRERVRQIENRAFEKLQHNLLEAHKALN